MTKENEEISISQIDFENESSLFKNTCWTTQSTQRVHDSIENKQNKI